MNKLPMHSPDLTQQNLEKIRAAFPNCVTEARDAQGNLKLAVDFDLLRQELSDSIVEGPQERYRLDWPGKREAMLTANAPIAKTLRPARDESVDFDETENLFIEGDNLEALKLLQESYLGKVKMIYIDPPYNTGKDFVYEDDFAESAKEFLERSNQQDEVGNRLTANLESNGRFHSDWLSMMLPRLRLARNLLREDGVIFISIDDGEQAALKSMCDEVFGEKNFLAQVIWERAFSPINLKKNFSSSHDYVISYAKNSDGTETYGLPRDEAGTSRYQNPDNDPRGPWQSDNFSVGPAVQKNIYEIITPNGKTILPPNGRSWLLSKERFEQFKSDNRIWFGEDGGNVPRVKRFLSEVKSTVTPMSIWKHVEVGHSQSASQALKKLFDDKSYFSYPKPVGLIHRCAQLYTASDDLIMDFFAGSSTTAHATMQLNAEDGGNRKFIMVQLPEEIDEKHEAYKAGYKTIAEISKERIRRAGKQILEGECHEDWNKDVGFRVLKVDTSNMKDVYYNPNEISQADLLDSVDHIKPDRSSEDLLFQVLLDWGVDLTLPIHRETIHGKEVFIVDQNALVACFERGVTEELVAELAQLQPLRMVFRDNGFASDSIKINATQIFKQRSPMTDVKSI